MCTVKGCFGNVIWSNDEGEAKISYVESDGDDVTMTVHGVCDICNTPHYAVVSGVIEECKGEAY